MAEFIDPDVSNDAVDASENSKVLVEPAGDVSVDTKALAEPVPTHIVSVTIPAPLTTHGRQLDDDDADTGGGEDEAQLLARENVNVVGLQASAADEKGPLLPPSLFKVELFDEGGEGEGIKHSSKSIYMYAMMQSMEEDSLLNYATLASVLTQLVQIVLLHGWLFAYFVGPSMKPKWNDWQATFSIPDEEGGMGATVASLVALAFAPVVIVIKLEKACEFELTPAFRATMRMKIRGKDYAKLHTHVLYYFWTTMYVLRAFVMIAYVANVNAALAVTEKKVRAILIMVLVVAFLLDLDEYTFLTFFAEKDELGALKLGPRSQTLIGSKTKAACENVRRTTMKVVTGYQIMLMLIMKTHPWMVVLWGMPIVACVLLYLQVRVFPPIRYTFLDSQIVLVLCMLVWLFLFRCVVLPVCGDGSRYFVDAVPWN